MKKTIITLLALSGAALADTSATIADKDITWIENGTNVSGFTLLASNTVSVTTVADRQGSDEKTNQTLFSNYRFDQQANHDMYDVLYGALNEGGTLTFNFTITSGTATSNNVATLLQCGRNGYGYGLSLYKQHIYLTLDGQSTGKGKDLGAITLAYTDGEVKYVLNDVAVTIADGKVQATINGVEQTAHDLAWEDVRWYTGSDGTANTEIYRYVVGQQAGGWTGQNLTGIANTTLQNFSASYKAAPIPEPATATLSLLALAGLCARRRRH